MKKNTEDTAKTAELRGLVKTLFAAMTSTGVTKSRLEWEPQCSMASIFLPSEPHPVTVVGMGKTEDVALRKLAMKLMDENMRRVNRMLSVTSGARKAIGPSVSSTLAWGFKVAAARFHAALRSRPKSKVK